MHSKVNVRRLCAGHYIMQCTLRHLGKDTGEYQSPALPEPAQNDSQHLATLRTFRIGRKNKQTHNGVGTILWKSALHTSTAISLSNMTRTTTR